MGFLTSTNGRADSRGMHFAPAERVRRQLKEYTGFQNLPVPPSASLSLPNPKVSPLLAFVEVIVPREARRAQEGQQRLHKAIVSARAKQCVLQWLL